MGNNKATHFTKYTGLMIGFSVILVISIWYAPTVTRSFLILKVSICLGKTHTFQQGLRCVFSFAFCIWKCHIPPSSVCDPQVEYLSIFVQRLNVVGGATTFLLFSWVIHLSLWLVFFLQSYLESVYFVGGPERGSYMSFTYTFCSRETNLCSLSFFYMVGVCVHIWTSEFYYEGTSLWLVVLS